MKSWLKFFALVLTGCVLNTQLVLAATQPVVSLSVSSTEAKKGDSVTIDMTVANNTNTELQDAILSLDLPVDNGLSFFSSSRPVEWTSDSRPTWRLGFVGANMDERLSITIRFNSDYAGNGWNAQATLSSSVNGENLQVYSNSVGAVLQKETESTKEQTKEEDTTQSVKEEVTVNNDKIEGLEAKVAEKIDVKALAGIADLEKYNNINHWDARFVVIGAVAFVLVLVVGLLAFFMGRKSK